MNEISKLIVIGGPLLAAALSALLVAVYRPGPLPYLVGCAVVGAAAAVAVHSAWIGFGVGMLLLLLLAIVNYPIQLVLDHRSEVRQVAATVTAPRASRVLQAAALPWAVAIALAGMGSAMHAWWIEAATVAAYNSGMIHIDRNEAQRSLENDLLFTLADSRSVAHERARIELGRTSDSATASLNAAPGIVDRTIESQRPAGIADHSCAGLRFDWLIPIPLDAVCRHLIWLGNREIKLAFDRLHQKAVESAQRDRDAALSRADVTVQVVANTTHRSIDAHFDRSERAVRSVFLYCRIAELVAFALLVGALLAAFTGALVRVLFATESGLSFRLDDAEAPLPADLSQRSYRRIELDRFGAWLWYVDRRAARYGPGTHERLCVPQPLGCIASRLLTGRYVLTRVNVDQSPPLGKETSPADTPWPPEVEGPADAQRPTLTSDKDRLVAIRLEPGRRLVFRMRSLVAFSDGITLRARFSTHMSLFFLGLWRIHPIAEGRGIVVLRASPHMIGDSRNLSTPVGNLLAWDSRQPMSLDQTGGPLAMWFNAPSVRLQGAQDLAVVHESQEPASSLARRCWRLLRFLFLPL